MTDHPAPSGRVGPWLEMMQAALRGERDADVPCGTCTACCSSSQFVTIEADETDALAHVPAALRFPAPGRSTAVVLPYDEQGRCPMLGEHGCSIYAHRPRACRTYDCRVFAVAEVVPDAPLVAERVRRWQLEVHDEADRRALDAVRAESSALRGSLPATAVAVRAVERARPDRT